MEKIEEIKSALRKLTREELAAFRRWFWEFDWEAWDKEIEEDVVAGRFDSLAKEAMRDLAEGRCTEL
jgi:hypothetical protein